MLTMNSVVSQNKKPALCRYFLSNGTCFRGGDCQFLHEIPPGHVPSLVAGQIRPNKRAMNMNQRLVNDQGSLNHMGDGFAPDGSNGDQFFSATFNGMPSFSQLPQGRNIGAKEFVPKSSSPAHTVAPPHTVPPHNLTHSSSTPSFTSYAAAAAQNYAPKMNSTPPHHVTPNAAGLSVEDSPHVSPRPSPTNSPMRHSTPDPQSKSTAPNADQANSLLLENVGGTTYFFSQEEYNTAPSGMVFPNFTMYPGMMPHVAHMKPKTNQPSFFMPDELKMELLNRQFITLIQIDADQSDLPREVDNYHSLVPIEPPPTNPMHKSSTFGYTTSVYKATSVKDGLHYCLRRIHGFRLNSTKCMAIIDLWKKLQHANIVQLRQVFTTKAFGDHSMVFVYDFHPAAENLMGRHFSGPSQAHQLNGYNNPYNLDGQARPYSAGKGGGLRQQAGLLSESLIWSYIVQLSSALRTIHTHGLACRVIDPTKVLLTDKSRLRLNCVGIFDVLSFDANQANPLTLMPQYQQEDLVSLGKTILALACNSIIGIQREHLQTSLDVVSRNYSADLKNLLFYLLNSQNRTRNINDIMPMIGARFYTQLDSCQLRNDAIEQELNKEVENGRVFRLLCKLGSINERAEYNLDPSWSETGDRYMLKLFRDYIFHQVDEHGAPWVDMSHVVQCLNKLDTGSSEKICLMSRDEQSVLVVTYSELKQCMETSFSELLQAQPGAPMLAFT